MTARTAALQGREIIQAHRGYVARSRPGPGRGSLRFHATACAGDVPLQYVELVDLSRAELPAAHQALNEILNGPQAIPEWEFQLRMGVTRDEALGLMRRIAAAL